eukprot:g12540.t1
MRCRSQIARFVLFCVFTLGIAIGPAAAAPPVAVGGKIEWAGKGRYRLIVEVAPADLKKRKSDEWPAQLKIDFVAELKKLGIEQRPDLSSLQVMRIDAETGRALPFADYAYAKSKADRPFRWYDGSIPDAFPEFGSTINATRGKIVRRPRLRFGYFLNTLGDWKSGRLAWVHSQSGTQPSRYAIYFNLLPKDAVPTTPPPRGWLGDGMARCEKIGNTTFSTDHCRIDLTDWNGDGLVDILVGEESGHLLWMPNIGTKTRPKFTHTRMVFDHKGLPIDAGVHCAPKAFDFDGDGKEDVLVGTYRNRILFFRNLGTNQKRKLEYRGQVTLGGKPLELPITPLAKGSSGVFKHDYYPILEFVDWDGDGDLDMLAGGYITGRIYFYENTGRRSDGTPELKFAGPILADGKPLNVEHWCAAPCIADFDGDGDLDLISGCMAMYDYGARKSRGNRFLRYYENVGKPGKPELRARSFPNKGAVPAASLATPRAADIDGDGDLDLVVSSRQDLYLLENVGTRTAPRFDCTRKALPSHWGSAPLGVDRFLDWNGDGKLDLIQAYRVKLNSGRGNPGEWKKSVNILPPGKYISHPSRMGDDWFKAYIDDFDGDGKYDVLFGDWFGHVWFHRNQSTGTENKFDIKGYKLKRAGGASIKVGPINKDPKKDFDALQGARTVLTVADFDGDGKRDLVVGDTYGIVRYFRNVGTKAEPVFAEPIEVGNLKIRLLVDATDWNNDGRPDIIAGAANGRVRVFLNTGKKGKARFAEGIDPGLPPITQPRVLMADLNGDGDTDLFVPSTQGACLVERSFLQRGYAEAKLLKYDSPMSNIRKTNREAKRLQEEVWANMDLFEQNYAKAIEILTAALEEDPGHITTLTNLGAALCDSGEHQRAKRYLKKAISRGSKDRNTWFNMGVACINTQSDPDPYFEQAAKLKASANTWEVYFDPHGH